MCPFWTTGPPHDLQITEVRSDSMVLIWKPPVYQGRDPVNGFYIDIKEADAPEEAWRGVNNKATDKTFIKVRHHQTEKLVSERFSHTLLQQLLCNPITLLSFRRLRMWRKQRRMCSVCELRIKLVLEKPQLWRSRSQLWPNQVREEQKPVLVAHKLITSCCNTSDCGFQALGR